MIVKELRATIACSKCNNKYEYTARATYTQIENIYISYLEPLMRKCTVCNKGDMEVRNVTCTISGKSKCCISWKCLHCGTTWIQHEYLDRNAMAGGKTVSQMVKVTCPNIFCSSKMDVLATSIVREQ